MGCDIARAPELVYAEGLDLEAAAVGIGLSCQLCDRAECRSRAVSLRDGGAADRGQPSAQSSRTGSTQLGSQ